MGAGVSSGWIFLYPSINCPKLHSVLASASIYSVYPLLGFSGKKPQTSKQTQPTTTPLPQNPKPDKKPEAELQQ